MLRQRGDHPPALFELIRDTGLESRVEQALHQLQRRGLVELRDLVDYESGSTVRISYALLTRAALDPAHQG